ncbi:hypothetical protein JMJ35_007908 [Cladonia borealis]|uniref:Azaphilone pigments biosynthesis cluster protein L N-terminal domain-containing protein n=1 Tax=Cladonia borealis TaxID=184061 RepID=A0AA39QWB8_9LECA|nr:hypothetical protein JMJ35_007908 [Cladonia borealis]
MDPISAAASIIGLIGAADTVMESLIKFIRSVRGAPKLAQTLLLEVSDVRAALTQLQRYLVGSKANARAHGDLLMVDQVIVTLYSCVKTFSELEEISESLKPAYTIQPGRMAQWVFKEERVRRLLSRLQHSKLSLNLMMATMTCSTVEEARASVEQLTNLVRKILENNQDMSQRMARLEVRTPGYSPSTAPSMFTSGETPAAVETHADSNSDNASCLTIKKASLGSEAMVSNSNNGCNPIFGFSFDDDLNNSRPYTRAMRRSLIWSPRTSAIGTIGWSCLSGLSLADVSEISVINLPVSPRELWNGARYSASYTGINGVLESIKEDLARTASESAPILRTPEPRVGAMTRLGSISLTSSRDPAKRRSTSFKLVKRLLKTRSESPVPEGRRTPSISIGDSGIPIAVLSRKILLLGASISGKTTIYNHLQILYGKDFTKAERSDAREWLVNYLIDAFKTAKEDMEFIQTDRGTEMKDAETFKLLAEATATGVLNDFYALRCYQVENVTLKIDQQPCQIFDVGGSRSERNKWGQCIKEVDTFIFVAPLTGYCQPLVEDPEINQMEESLIIFEQITKLEEANAVPILLLLTKVDLFKKMMIQTPICDTFPEYSGSLGCVTACNFFANEFAKRDERHMGTLRVCVTCAVDPTMFEGTVESIKSLLVTEKSNLKAAVSKSTNTSPVFERFANSPEQDVSHSYFGRVKSR